jgi:hypothetical protein
MAPDNKCISADTECPVPDPDKDGYQWSLYHLALALLLLIVLAWGGNTQAEIYQWRDDNGRLHFSDEPPPSAGIDASKVELQPISGYTSAPEHKQGLSSSSSSSTSSGSASKAARAARVAAEQKRKALQQQRCDKYRRLYRNTSKSLTSDINYAVKTRDKKNTYRDKIREYCH